MSEVNLSQIKLLHTLNYEDKPIGLKLADGALYLASAALGYEDLTLTKGKVDADGNPLFESVTKVDNVFLRFLAGLAAIVTLPLTLVGLVVKWCLQNKQTEQIQSIRNKALPPPKEQLPGSSAKGSEKPGSTPTGNRIPDLQKHIDAEFRKMGDKAWARGENFPKGSEPASSSSRLSQDSPKGVQTRPSNQSIADQAHDEVRDWIREQGKAAEAQRKREAEFEEIAPVLDEAVNIFDTGGNAHLVRAKVDALLAKGIQDSTLREKVTKVKQALDNYCKRIETPEAVLRMAANTLYLEASKLFKSGQSSKVLELLKDFVKKNGKDAENILIEDWGYRNSGYKNLGIHPKGGLTRFATQDEFFQKLKAEPGLVLHRMHLAGDYQALLDETQKLRSEAEKKYSDNKAFGSAHDDVTEFYRAASDGSAGKISLDGIQAKMRELLKDTPGAREYIISDWRFTFPLDLTSDEEIIRVIFKGAWTEPTVRHFFNKNAWVV
jgi:hypothetical protein